MLLSRIVFFQIIIFDYFIILELKLIWFNTFLIFLAKFILTEIFLIVFLLRINFILNIIFQEFTLKFELIIKNQVNPILFIQTFRSRYYLIEYEIHLFSNTTVKYNNFINYLNKLVNIILIDELLFNYNIGYFLTNFYKLF